MSDLTRHRKIARAWRGGASYRQVASLIGVSQESIRSLISKARRALGERCVPYRRRPGVEYSIIADAFESGDKLKDIGGRLGRSRSAVDNALSRLRAAGEIERNRRTNTDTMTGVCPTDRAGGDG